MTTRRRWHDTSAACWLWTRGKNSDGYGVVKINGRVKTVHRVIYEVFSGKIPDGMCVLHHCDTPACVNPQHLFLGTKADNTADMMKKERHRSPKGSDHKRSKLKEKDIPNIRKMAAEGISQREIAKTFDVSQPVIQGILAGKAWAHV